MSEISSADPKTLTPQQARIAFDEFAKQIHAEDGSRDFVAAWAKAKLLRPDLAERMCQPDSALANEATLAKNAFYLAMMSLPPTISSDEFSAAWLANGSKPAPVNAKAMFDALTGFAMGKTNLSLESAREATIKKFPALAQRAGYSTWPNATPATA